MERFLETVYLKGVVKPIYSIPFGVSKQFLSVTYPGRSKHRGRFQTRAIKKGRLEVAIVGIDMAESEFPIIIMPFNGYSFNPTGNNKLEEGIGVRPEDLYDINGEPINFENL